MVELAEAEIVSVFISGQKQTVSNMSLMIYPYKSLRNFNVVKDIKMKQLRKMMADI